MIFNKRKQYIDIFKEDNKNVDLYIVAIIGVILLSIFQFGMNYKRYSDLNQYIEENKINLNQSAELKEDQSNNEPSNEIDISTLRESSNIIGTKNIKSIKVNNQEVEMSGIVQDTKEIVRLKKYGEISNLSVEKLEKEGDNYLFTIRYDLGGK